MPERDTDPGVLLLSRSVCIGSVPGSANLRCFSSAASAVSILAHLG